jgi:hypothetical protein
MFNGVAKKTWTHNKFIITQPNEQSENMGWNEIYIRIFVKYPKI